MEAVAKIIPAQFAYISIPTNSLRSFFDHQFASFAKCSTADYLTGFPHRYRGGHDLLLDISSTFKGQGLKEATHQAGHILLTDFPTKAGIPIPGFSQSGLGGLLQEWGISSGWLQLNICDVGVGIIAVSESHPELYSALDGLIKMDTSTFFDTFVEGSVEVALAFYFENPILLYAGVENLLTGFISAYQTFSICVDPLDLLGSGIISAITGFFVTKLLRSGDSNNKLAYINALRAGIVGGFFAINPAFGFGAILAILSVELGKYIAQGSNKDSLIKIDIDKTELFLNCFVNPDESFENVIKDLPNLFSINKENINEVGSSFVQYENTLSINNERLHEPKTFLISEDSGL